MKREHLEQYEHGIYKHYGWFFWRQCCKCNHGFRRDRGWKFLSGPFFQGVGHWRYLCGTCAPTKKDANQLAMAGVYRGTRPPRAPFQPRNFIMKDTNIGPGDE